MDIEERKRRNREKQRAWRAAHPATEEQKAKHAIYMREYWSRNPEKANELRRRYREEHRDEIAAKLKADRKLRPEYYAAIDAKKYAKNHDEILARMRAYNRRGKVQRRAMYGGLQRRFGLSAEQYDQLVLASCGRCAICNDIFTDPKSPAVDHCHRLGRIRGLLCGSCNLGIGKLKDSPDLLEAAARYLRS